MPKPTAMDESQIRASAVQVFCLANNIMSQAVMLREKFDLLYPYLEFADPVKDMAFNRYMVTLARAMSLCDVMPSLAAQAQEMQRYRKPQLPPDVTSLNRITIAPACQEMPSVAALAERGSVPATIT